MMQVRADTNVVNFSSPEYGRNSSFIANLNRVQMTNVAHYEVSDDDQCSYHMQAAVAGRCNYFL